MTTTATAAADAGLGTAHITGTEVLLRLESGIGAKPNPVESPGRRTINTKKVRGRRIVRYECYQDLLNDAALLATKGARPLGNWTVGQVLCHLAQAIDLSISGFPGTAPWWVRLAAPLFRRRILRGPMPAGFKLPIPASRDALSPPDVSADEGLARLRRAVARIQLDTERASHPVFGELSLDEWDLLHLRHAELHASFLILEPALSNAGAVIVGTEGR